MPKPKPNESHNEFIDRCVPYVMNDGTAETNEQAVAVCENIWAENSKSDTIETGTMYRNMTFDRDAINEDERTVELSFSSEDPYTRFFGVEILGHAQNEVRLERLNKAGPVLIDHYGDQIGVVLEAQLDDAKGKAKVKISRSQRGEEIWQDIKDGIRRNVSVAYAVHKMRLEEEEEGKEPVYRVTDWEPLEISIVAVPADTTVGVGRARDGEQAVETTIIGQRSKNHKQQGEKAMNKYLRQALEVIGLGKDADEAAAKQFYDSLPDAAKKNADAQANELEQKANQPSTPSSSQVNVENERQSAMQAERERISEIEKLGKDFSLDTGEAIRNGTSVEEFRKHVLDQMQSKGNLKPVQNPNNAQIGMKTQETRDFSFRRAILGQVPNSGIDAGFERECSQQVAKNLGIDAKGILVPAEVMKDQQRDMSAGSAADGGYLVETNLLTSSFIELLRNKLALRAMGATVLDGLVGDVAIPGQDGTATAYWLDEGGKPTKSNFKLKQVGMNPHTVGAVTLLTRKLLLQASMSVEQMVRQDIATKLALEIDRAGLNGDGKKAEPLGLLNTSGIGDVSVDAVPGWGDIVDLETKVAAENADIGTLGYLTNAEMRGVLKQTEQASNTAQWIWQVGANGQGMLNGYRAMASNQVPNDLGGSNDESAIVFGNWSDLVIGQWGTLDLTVDPYSESESGGLKVIGLQDVDMALRRKVSFAAIKDARKS